MFFVVFSESVAFGTQTKYRILDERSVQGLYAEVAAVFGAENVHFCHSRKSVDVAVQSWLLGFGLWTRVVALAPHLPELWLRTSNHMLLLRCETFQFDFVDKQLSKHSKPFWLKAAKWSASLAAFINTMWLRPLYRFLFCMSHTAIGEVRKSLTPSTEQRWRRWPLCSDRYKKTFEKKTIAQ